MFSIIIPNFNNSKYLDELFESIKNQTFDEYEIIFVDDVSTDNSLEKVKKWSNKFKNFTIVSNKEKRWNGGSRNAGLNLAKGKYTLFIDSDDKIASDDCLEKLVETIIINDYPDLVRLSYYLCSNSETYVDLSSQDTLEKIGADCNVACWTKLIKTELIVKFPENTLMEDVVQHYRQLERIKSIATTNKGIIKWNRNNTNSVSTQRKNRTSELDKKWVSSFYRYYADLLELKSSNKIIQDSINKRIERMKTNIKTDRFVQD